ncbi:MAG: DUF2062 domain-containing protein [Candidatus Omnitrophica bacterium]|nr:DUF2062 domain-containing protein [Candidatus Omnitrophota bacterium]
MKNKKYARLLRFAYNKLFLINDSPHKIALGLSLGVFTGIIPGVGPIAAILLALLLRANRISAILGSLLTNTWITFVTFLLSIKVGSAIIKTDWHDVYAESLVLLHNFRWQDLFKESLLNVVLPLLLGYLVIALCLALTVYVVTLVLVKRIKYARKNRAKFSQ